MSRITDLTQNESLTETVNLDAIFTKIEKVKLYEWLLQKPLFEQIEADEAIVNDVTQELQQFIINQLTKLMGNQVESNNTVEQKLTSRQINVLSELANRIIAASSSNNKSNNSNRPNKLPKRNKTVTQQKSFPVQLTSSQVSTQQIQTQNKKYAQAVNPSHPPMPMPSQEQINAHYAALVNQQNTSQTADTNDPAGQLLAAAINLALAKNKDLKEENND